MVRVGDTEGRCGRNDMHYLMQVHLSDALVATVVDIGLTATTLSIAARTDWAAWWHAVVAQPALRDLERAQKAAPAAPGLSGPIVSVQLAFGHFAPTLSIVLIRHACTTPSRQPASPPG